MSVGGTHRFQIGSPNLTFRDSNNSTTRSISYNTTFVPGEWTHVACIYNRGQIIIYVNGVQTNCNKTYYHDNSVLHSDLNQYRIGRIRVSSGDIYYEGKLNDFRIYDHALSAVEVKQLSQGLILHYLLNHNGFGNDNLSTDTLIEKSLSKKADGAYFTPVNLYPLSEDARSIILNSQVGDLVTYSFDYEIENNEVENYQMRAVLKTGGSSFSTTGLQYVYSKGGILPLGNSSGHAEATFKLKQTHKTYGTGWLITAAPSKDNSLNIKAKITHFKFEIGGKATPWCLNPIEIPTDSIFGYNDDIEYDCSGYKNNGAKEGTFNYILDTPKYNVSTIFNGSNYIEAEPLPDETKTISVWVNYQTLPTGSDYNGFIIFDKNTQMSICVYSSGQYLITYIGSSKGGTGSRVITSFQENKWYHIVVLKTGATTREVYINGVKATPSGTNYWSGDLNKLLIGIRHAAGVYKEGANAKICDFRAYVTLLSPQDILSLYNNEAYIDNNGNIYGAVYEEG